MAETLEAKFVTALQKCLEAKFGCRVHNMHGNMYQSGIPDKMVIRPIGDFCLVEAKHFRLARGVTSMQMQQALKPEQKKNLAIWAHNYRCHNNLYVAAWNSTTGDHYVVRGVDLPPLMGTAHPIPLPELTLEEVARVIATGGVV